MPNKFPAFFITLLLMDLAIADALCITDVDVVDVKAGRVAPAQTLLVEGDRIQRKLT